MYPRDMSAKGVFAPGAFCGFVLLYRIILVILDKDYRAAF
jgi:hypothetical protein